MKERVYLALISLFAAFVRWCVSLGGHSGEGKPPMFGDFEAQRHWMEITVNLPIKEWYTNSSRNDLMYWGLDYPPLTAVHSYLMGLVARFINPDWIALYNSRGHESYQHKLFMRYTVLAADLLLYFPAVYWIFSTRKPNSRDKHALSRCYLLMLLYPGLILIDHGHFQYNCISLGLTLIAMTCLTTGQDGLGSVFFCLALNYKQMELYHALPFFFYLLGDCVRNIRGNGFLRLLKIAAAVLITFGLCWAPFLHSKEAALQVLHRLFPFARGIFEDKVANVWCSLSVIIKFKQILSQDRLVLMCLITTGVVLLPSCLDLLFRPTLRKFRYALVNSSLIFFLFSFQVHEKSILIAAVIVCTFIPDHPFWCFWFLLISTFSMLPLLIKDGLLIPFIASMIMYVVLYQYLYPVEEKPVKQESRQAIPWTDIIAQLLFCISMVGMVILTVVTIVFPPPEPLPDLFNVLISIFSCGHFILFLGFFLYRQISLSGPTTAINTAKKLPGGQKPNDKNNKVAKQAQPKASTSKSMKKKKKQQ